MAGNDREPIGRKGKPTRPVKQKVSRRRYEDDDDYDLGIFAPPTSAGGKRARFREHHLGHAP